MSTALHERDAWAIADAVRAGEVSAVEVTEHHLERIECVNPALNALVHVDPERALTAARAVDAAVASGTDPGPLAGVPLAVKETEAVEGWPWWAGSTVHRERVAQHTTIQPERLLRAGAVPVGLSAAPEMGALPYTTSLLHGPTRNPWNRERTPGGSSGGSAAALSAGLVATATGGDIGGSIRVPAALTGLVGIKPTFGRVPRGPGYLGVANMFHPGPLGRSVRDVARYLDCVAGPDQRDPYSLPVPRQPFEAAATSIELAGLRVAFLRSAGVTEAAAAVGAVVEEALTELIAFASLDRRTAELPVPDLLRGAPPLVSLDADPGDAHLTGEIFSNLASTPNAAPFLFSAFQDGSPLNTGVDAVRAAVALRQGLNDALAAVFREVDLLVTPTSPVVAFAAEGPVPDTVDGRPVSLAALVSFVLPFNLTGNPACSVPAGLVDGLPVGMQIVGRRHEDALVLAAAAALESARPWPKVAQ